MNIIFLAVTAASVLVPDPRGAGTAAAAIRVHATNSGTTQTARTAPGDARASAGSARRLAREPADSLYRAAREALGNGDYERAAELFHAVVERFPKSPLVPDAMYYEAFARYRSGSGEDLIAARRLLRNLSVRYSVQGRWSDAAALSTRICGELAQRGDAGCAATIAAEVAPAMIASARSAARAAVQTSVIAGLRAGAASAMVASGVGPDHAAAGDTVACPTGRQDEQIAALNALTHMDPSRAEPILARVLARRDRCSAALRRTAVMMVAQSHSPEAVDVLLRAAQTDPDPSVQKQAVFWLGQMPGDRSVAVLNRILNSASDRGIRDRAIFALAQNRSAEARQIIRDYARNQSAPQELREKAVFWIGQTHDPDNAAFLRQLFAQANSRELKDKVLFALSQQNDPAGAAWLLDVARNGNETLDVRKKALFFASQGGLSIQQLVAFYESLPPGEMRQQVVFALSQRREPAAIDKLMDVARSDPDPAARRTALFWLSQSHDPRVTRFLEEMISR